MVLGSQEPSPASTPQNKEKPGAQKTLTTQGAETSTNNFSKDTSEEILADPYNSPCLSVVSFSGSDFEADSENEGLIQDLLGAPKDIAQPPLYSRGAGSLEALPRLLTEETHSEDQNSPPSKSHIAKIDEGTKVTQKERSVAAKKRRNKRKKAKKKSTNI